MNNQRVVQRPASAGFRFDRFKLTFGHAGVMLQRHRRHRLAALPRLMDIAHQTDKHAHAAHRRVAGGEGGQFSADVEIFRLNPHRHRFQPPVTGGNSATSSPDRSG